MRKNLNDLIERINNTVGFDYYDNGFNLVLRNGVFIDERDVFKPMENATIYDIFDEYEKKKITKIDDVLEALDNKIRQNFIPKIYEFNIYRDDEYGEKVETDETIEAMVTYELFYDDDINDYFVIYKIKCQLEFDMN